MTTSKKLSFLISFALPLLAIFSELRGGFFYLTVPLTVFLFLPLIDLAVGRDPQNPPAESFSNLQSKFYFRALTIIWAYMQLVFVLWASYRVAAFPKSTLDLILFALTCGIITGGVGITVGHELGHKASKYEQFLSKMIYMTVCYMHFFIEHNRGHHTNVSTPHDPASSRKDESFYQFYPRTVLGSFRSAWAIESKRLAHKGLSPFSYHNEMVIYALITFAFATFLGLLAYAINPNQILAVLGFFALQSFFAFSLLEMVNYIEHYGLKRKQMPSGQFEKVLPIHSWNQNFFVSNAFLFQLQRHSDHHANPTRRYQALRHFEEAPQLPFGYEVMILIALLPPLWFRLVNPILEKWENSKGLATHGS